MAETSPIFLASKTSVPALIQRLFDQGKLSLLSHNEESGSDDFVAFFQSNMFKVVTKKAAILDMSRSCPHITKPMSALDPSRLAPISFEVLVFFWRMTRAFSATRTVEGAVRLMNLHTVDFSDVDIHKELGIEPVPEEKWNLRAEDLFAMLYNSFFIDAHPASMANGLLIHAMSRLMIDYENRQKKHMVVDGYCYALDKDNFYYSTLYGAFVGEYLDLFITDYKQSWTLNKDRFV